MTVHRLAYLLELAVFGYDSIHSAQRLLAYALIAYMIACHSLDLEAERRQVAFADRDLDPGPEPASSISSNVKIPTG
jgi:hypothetical protein